MEEAGGAKEGKEEKKEERKGLAEKMFGDFMTPKEVKAGKQKVKKIVISEKGKSEAVNFAKSKMFIVYKNFKKAHRMIMW